MARDITRDKQELRDQRLETIGNVASGLAHDLNNILAPITLSIEMLKEMYPDSDEMVDTIEQCSKRASQMVQQLLNYVKGHAGTVAVFQLKDVMNETVELLRFTLPKKVSIDFSFDLLDTLIYGDSTQIQQMLINLAVNARDAMPEGGVLSSGSKKWNFLNPSFLPWCLFQTRRSRGCLPSFGLRIQGLALSLTNWSVSLSPSTPPRRRRMALDWVWQRSRGS